MCVDQAVAAIWQLAEDASGLPQGAKGIDVRTTAFAPDELQAKAPSGQLDLVLLIVLTAHAAIPLEAEGLAASG
jgi:hypothetical protein